MLSIGQDMSFSVSWSLSKFTHVVSPQLWPVVRVSAGVGPGVELAAVGGVEAGHEAVVRQHRVEVLHTAARVQLLKVQEEGSPVSISPGVLGQPAKNHTHSGTGHPVCDIQSSGDCPQQARHASDRLVPVGVAGALYDVSPGLLNGEWHGLEGLVHLVVDIC